ncbi:carbohydrate-binding protein [Nonomuraea sp. NPDC059007]|uniref:glycosyl hydrolase family 95 catalytic domain-containing protein n=1 Tax=Nonomuraea sp. NPDC059007 TaxID=3346692 RepID=UPI00369CAF46
MTPEEAAGAPDPATPDPATPGTPPAPGPSPASGQPPEGRHPALPGDPVRVSDVPEPRGGVAGPGGVLPEDPVGPRGGAGTWHGQGVSRRVVLGGAFGSMAVAAFPGGLDAAWAGAAWELDKRVSTPEQWRDFLERQDLLWARLPTVWHEGPFLGDGLLGSMVYKEPGANKVRFTTQHGRVQDHRPQFGSGFGTCRLPVGHLTLDPAGTITAVDWRLSLWDAELTGSITTTAGRITFTAFVHDELFVADATATGGEQVRWTFHPEAADSPREASEAPPSGYVRNPAWTTRTTGEVRQVLQALAGGGQTATAYRQSGGLLLLSVAHSFPSNTAAEAACLAKVRDAGPYQSLRSEHQAWWHAFYPKSFLSLPDERLQSFYWIQLYKTASATRAGGPVMATTGPWLEPTPWPGVWWNLNVQLEYWLIHGSNHLELDSVTTTLDRNRQRLVDNVPSAYRADSSGVGRSSDMFATRSVGTPGSGAEVGDLTWALHNVWLSYRHTMDDTLLRDTLFPLLRRAINYYLHFLRTEGDGRLHLPSTLSPEYPVVPPKDTNYDLALIRWGCQTLLDAAARLGVDDPLKPRWQSTLANLTPYPTDGNGYMIGASTPYSQSHRHYSHLMMIYPLYLVTWDQPASRTLIERSIARWHAVTGAHRGYSYTGAASMYASMGRGDTALGYLTCFFDPATSYPCRANTHYTEAGPVIETPLSASQSIHDMLCQSWGGVIRVFPAVPSAWPDVTLHDFRTQGAFLVSAVRQAGTTRFIRVRSLAGEPLKLRHGLPGPPTATLDDGTPAQVTDLGGGTVQIVLAKDREVLLHTGPRPPLVVDRAPISRPGARWGLPGTPSPPGRHEAENALISQGVVESNHAGFSGSGFVNLDNLVGSYVEFTVAAAGASTLTIGFANGTTSGRPMTVTVDGAAAGSLDFPPTGAWTTWRTVSLPARLGTKVRLTSATASGGPNLDYLDVAASGTDYQAEDAVITQGAVESNHAGFTGSGFVNLDNVVGSAAEFTVTGGGTRTITVRFANGTAVARPMDVLVDGVRAGALTFPPTGAWTTWHTLSLQAQLGTKIKLVSTSANGGPNLDKITIG